MKLIFILNRLEMINLIESQFIPTAYHQHQVLFMVKAIVKAQLRETPLSPDLFATGIIQVQLISDHSMTRNQVDYCQVIELTHPDQPFSVKLTQLFETQHDAVLAIQTLARQIKLGADPQRMMSCEQIIDQITEIIHETGLTLRRTRYQRNAVINEPLIPNAKALLPFIQASLRDSHTVPEIRGYLAALWRLYLTIQTNATSSTATPEQLRLISDLNRFFCPDTRQDALVIAGQVATIIFRKYARLSEQLLRQK